MYYLQFHRNELPLFEYKLRSRKIRLGRSDSCDIALPGEMISRIHCQLEFRNGKWLLSDDSRHGTFVEGKRITKQVIEEDTQFSLGEYQISLKSFGEKRSETTEIFSVRNHEFLQGKAEKLVTESAYLVQELGKGKIKEYLLRRAQYTIGGKGSDIEISKRNHLKNHAMIYVSRGRVMVSPKEGPVFWQVNVLGALPLCIQERRLAWEMFLFGLRQNAKMKKVLLLVLGI